MEKQTEKDNGFIYTGGFIVKPTPGDIGGTFEITFGVVDTP